MRSRRFFMVLACCLLTAAAAMAQGLDPGKRISQYATEHWDDEDGLPPVQVYDVAQTPDGYLWLATGDGLVRFDGVRFTVLSSLNTPAFTSDDVFALDVGSEGRLWIGTSDGSVLVRAGPRIDRLVDPDRETEDGVMAIHEDRSGDLWVWRDLGGLARYRTSGAGLVDAGLPPELAGVALPPLQIPRRSIYEDRAGRLWLASQGGGLYALDAEGLRHLTTADGLSHDFVHTVAEDADGTLWIGSDGGLDRYLDGKVTAMISALGLAGGAVVALAADRAGSVWIGKRYVYRWAGGRLEQLEATGEIRGELCLHEDGEGSLWIGTAGDGLFRLRDDGITPLGPPEGFPDTIVLAITEDRAGRMLIGTSRAGLVVLDGGEMTPERRTAVTTADGLPHDLIWSIHQGGGGADELWLGTDGGLVRLSGGLPPGGEVRVFTTADGLSDDRVRVVYEDPQEGGTLWLGTIEGGVSRLRDGAFRRWTTADVLANANVRWLHKDRAGALWIGLQNGLQRLPAADAELETFTKDDGLASTRMRAVYEDADGTLWLGTSGGGLSRYRDGRFVSYTRKAGLVCDDVWGILEDDEGNFWLTGGCASRVAKHDFEAYDAGRIPRLGAEEVAAQAFERTTCCTAGGYPAGWKSRDGRLWFPGAPGLVVVDPRRQGLDELPPAIVESIVVDGEVLMASGALTIRPGAENLEIHYTCPSLSAARRLAFRYRLAGFDDDWVAAGERRVAYYSRLPPGRYEFQVAASAAPGQWQEPAATSLRLLPLWWQTLWFRGAALFAVIGSAAAWHQIRTRRIDERRRRLQREVDERRRAEQALRAEVAERERAQEALREHREQLAHVGRVTTMGELAAALAHELNQPLTAIGANAQAAQRFLAGPEPDLGEIREILDDVAADNRRAAEVIRRLRAMMKKDELRLERVDVNEAVAEVMELLRSEAVIHGVALEARLADGLPPVEADRVHLWQVLVNLIRNAVEAMGETPAGERRIVVGTEHSNGEVRLAVRDSGAGFGGQEAAALFAPFHSTKAEGLGMGLAISKSIIEAHGGRIWAAENPDRGVTFHFTLPAADRSTQRREGAKAQG